jgi:hypothetical protein
LYHIIDGSKKYVSIQLTIALPSNVGFEGPAAAPIARLKDANLGPVGMSIRSIDPFHIGLSNVDFPCPRDGFADFQPADHEGCKCEGWP